MTYPEFHNVPPWDYEPEGLLAWELREGPRVIMSGCTGDIDLIAINIAKFLLPPRLNTLFRMWDANDQLILGWCDNPDGGQDILGCRAAFAALELRADQLLVYEMERVANPGAYVDG